MRRATRSFLLKVESDHMIPVVEKTEHSSAPEKLPPTDLALSADRPSTAAPESVRLLNGGAATYPRMLRAIAQAQRTVLLEVFSFSSSGVGALFIEALGLAVSRGVTVRVQIDGWGSVWGGRAVASALRRAGCSVLIYNRLRALFSGRIGRNHRKVLLVDDEVAFLGGLNIGDENLTEGSRLAWADLALEIRGPQCTRLGMMLRHEPHHRMDTSLQIHLCGLGGGWRLRERYLKAFSRAQLRIQVAHGFFLPDAGIVGALKAAARRGVAVRLLLAGNTRHPFARAATRSLHRQLLEAGVHIHELRDSLLHAKVATVDGERLLLGSFNLDPFSLSNLETLVEVDDARVVGQVEGWIQRHLAHSHQVKYAGAGSWLRRWLFDPLGRIVTRLAKAVSHVIVGRKQRLASIDASYSVSEHNREP